MRKRNNAIGPQIRQKKLNNKRVPLLAMAFMIGGLQIATQYLAYQFHYQSVLGRSIHHLYWPWSIVTWWQQWQGYYPTAFSTAVSIGMMVTAGGLIGCVLFKMVSAHSSKVNPYLHGSARWADKQDLIEAGLLGNDQGVYVGAWEDTNGVLHYLRHNGPEHVLTYAPTRSGKGLGLVLPTLLSWPHSVFITDLKGELWAMTAGWRQQYAKNKVIRFEPASSEGSACWNSVQEIRIGSDNEVGDTQNLATLVVDPDGKGLISHWQKTAQSLLVGLLLHALYKAPKEGHVASLPYIDRMIADPNHNISNVLNEMKTYKHVNDRTHPVVSSTAQDMIDRPEEEAGSIVSTLKSYLALYRDPVVAKNVSSSDFLIKDLMNHDCPVSLYILTQPNDKDRLQPLVRVLINMIVRLSADRMTFERVATEQSTWQRFLTLMKFATKRLSFVRSKKTYKHRLLGMIDEFPSLGKLDILQESLAFVAGYGIKFYLICQDINQLKSREKGYGPDETITSNCHIQNAFPPNRLETAEHLSKLTGQTTIVKEQITTSGRRSSAILSQVSKTMQEVQRPLLTADECLRMPGPKKNAEELITEAGDMVVYVAGFPAIYGRQALYFQDPIFTARAAIPEPLYSDRLRQPTVEDSGITL